MMGAAVKPDFDLQSHSTCSDGALEPAGVVAAAAAAGVRLLALTDHDTVDGVAEALAEAERQQITVVPATELSSVDELGEDLHILGYGVDHTDLAFGEQLAAWREDRAQRMDRMAAKLTDLGLEPDWRQLEERRAAGLPIGRPHLAAAVDSAHEERLAREGLAETSAFLTTYLLPGQPGYSRRTTPDVAGAIEAIHAAGGVAVWAHPFWDVKSADDVGAAVRRFSAAGLDGVEAFYIAHDREQTFFLAGLAQELGLLSTGSADFHGPEHRHFSRFRAFDLHGCEPDLGPVANWTAGPASSA
jgi:predicted metal-dependent phosphoesterase TrpH